MAHDSEAPFASFYSALKQPDTGVSCCSISDCEPVEARVGWWGYEAYTGTEWVRIPTEKIVRGKKNPVGRAILCRSAISHIIYCFVPAAEG